jgi:putative DNA primase/helicase
MTARNGQQPLPPAVQAALEAARACARELGYDVDSKGGGEDGPEGATESKPTDDDLAEQWCVSHTDSAFGLGSMRRYRDGVWEVLPDDLFERELLEVLQANKGRGIRPTSRLLASVRKLAQIKASVPDYVWDADPNILVCANGTLDLNTMTLREHCMGDYVTSAIPHPYIPDATAPTLEHVLRTTVPEAAGLIQEFAGYALTTDTSHELALWFCGPSGSGKSTIILALQNMLGKRCGVLGLADIERSNFALSDLPGRTLLISTEQPSLYVRASHKLNALISGEVLRVEKKYADPFCLKPTAKVLWASNEMPRLDPGDGLFRRVKVIRFTKPTFVPDPGVKQRIAREGAGILAWALEGLRRLRERGHFLIPQCVEEASQQFRMKNDVPATFVDECCEVGPDCKASAEELYRAYKTWCEENGHRPQSSTALAEEWARLGFERFRSNGRSFYRGVSLRALPS